MIEFICGVIIGSGIKRIQEEQDKATKCIFKYEEYRRKIITLENEKKRLEYDLKSVQKR